MQETWVRFLGWEDFPGEGNGNPLQHSCLENPMNRAAWQAAVHVAKADMTATRPPPLLLLVPLHICYTFLPTVLRYSVSHRVFFLFLIWKASTEFFKLNDSYQFTDEPSKRNSFLLVFFDYSISILA